MKQKKGTCVRLFYYFTIFNFLFVYSMICHGSRVLCGFRVVFWSHASLRLAFHVPRLNVTRNGSRDDPRFDHTKRDTGAFTSRSTILTPRENQFQFRMTIIKPCDKVAYINLRQINDEAFRVWRSQQKIDKIARNKCRIYKVKLSGIVGGN